MHSLSTTFANRALEPRKQGPYFGHHESHSRLNCYASQLLDDDVVDMTVWDMMVGMLTMTIARNFGSFLAKLPLLISISSWVIYPIAPLVNPMIQP